MGDSYCGGDFRCDLKIPSTEWVQNPIELQQIFELLQTLLLVNSRSRSTTEVKFGVAVAHLSANLVTLQGMISSGEISDRKEIKKK